MCPNKCMCNNNDFNNNYTNTVSSRNYNSYSNELGNGYSSSTYNAGNTRYGYAYVPTQTFNNVFSPAQGLANGTMFPELVSPYCPNQSLEVMNYLKYHNNGGGCCRNGM